MSDPDLACIHELNYRSGEGYLACVFLLLPTPSSLVYRERADPPLRVTSPRRHPRITHDAIARKWSLLWNRSMILVRDAYVVGFLAAREFRDDSRKVRIRSISDKPTCDPRREWTRRTRMGKSHRDFISPACYSLDVCLNIIIIIK